MTCGGHYFTEIVMLASLVAALWKACVTVKLRVTDLSQQLEMVEHLISVNVCVYLIQ